MRPLEIILLFVESVALAGFAPVPAPLLWMRHAAALAFVAALAEASIEGPRWQMAPAYALAGLLFAIWLTRLATPATGLVGRDWAKWIAVCLGAPAIAISLAMGILFPVFRIPTPGGPFGIGTLTYHWVDADRPELFVDDPSARRELMVQIWYPAGTEPGRPRAPYVEDGAVLAPLARLLHLPGFIFGYLKYIRTNAVVSAPAAGGAAFPLLIFSHGRGGFRQHDTWLVEELVSRGYVVAAIDHTFAASGVIFPDGRLVTIDPRMTDRKFVDAMVPYLAGDVVFALSRITALNDSDPMGILGGRLDLGRVGIFGLSLGGEVSAEASLLDRRIRASLIMDVWMPADVLRRGLDVPTMWLSRDAGTMRREGWREADIDETLSTMRSVYDSLPRDGYFVLVPGMYHQDFSDAPLLSPLTSLLGMTGPIDGRRAHEILGAYALAFFDRYLSGKPGSLLDGPSPRFPEVLFDSRRP